MFLGLRDRLSGWQLDRLFVCLCVCLRVSLLACVCPRSLVRVNVRSVACMYVRWLVGRFAVSRLADSLFCLVARVLGYLFVCVRVC